jgi:hypothetical protein
MVSSALHGEDKLPVPSDDAQAKALELVREGERFNS